MGYFKIGTMLNVDGLKAQVIGYVVYCNPNDRNVAWVEYRLQTKDGERWLSWDEDYQEYSISWPSYLPNGRVSNDWKKVDEGVQVVESAFGDVDVDPGERATFVEYEDETEEQTLSLEIWEDGTEVSKGYYLDPEEIEYLGVKDPVSGQQRSKEDHSGFWILALLGAFFALRVIFPWFGNFLAANQKIEAYLKKSREFSYVTSVTGKEGEKAQVYRYREFLKETSQKPTTDSVARNIIDGVEGNTEVVTENKEDAEDGSISILTKREYCLIYYPEGNEKTVYVQVSDRKYNYTSDNRPYRARNSTHLWYRRHYYSSGYTKDASKWSKIPSAYTMYDGPIVQDLGNGYYDVYSNTVRQSSIQRRNSDSGGFRSGK